jgi:hypothetical protein
MVMINEGWSTSDESSLDIEALRMGRCFFYQCLKASVRDSKGSMQQVISDPVKMYSCNTNNVEHYSMCST